MDPSLDPRHRPKLGCLHGHESSERLLSLPLPESPRPRLKPPSNRLQDKTVWWYYRLLTLTHNQPGTASILMSALYPFLKLMGNIDSSPYYKKSIWLIANKNPLSVDECCLSHFELFLLPDKTVITLERSQCPTSPFDHLRRLIDLAYLLFYFLII